MLVESIVRFFRFEKGNYRRGGLFMLPGITLGIVLAYIFGDRGKAMLSIAIAGYSTAITLILAGDRNRSR